MNDLLDQAWDLLTRGVHDRTLASNRPTLATSGPELRTVVLRAASRTTQTLDIHSDARAGKIGQLRRDPQAALHVWDADARLQIRIRARAELHIDDDEAHRAFAALPEHGQRIYTAAAQAGAPIPMPDAVTFDGPAHFALIRLHLSEIELLHLSRDLHRRAQFRAAQGWAGRWLVP